MSLLKYCGALLISFYALSANAEYKYFENQEEVDKVLKEVKCSDDKELCRQMGVLHVLTFAISCSEKLADINGLDEAEREEKIDKIIALGETWNVLKDKELRDSFYTNTGLVESLIAEQQEYFNTKNEKFIKDFCKFEQVIINQEQPEAYSGLKP